MVTAAQEAAPNSTGAENEIHSDDERQNGKRSDFEGLGTIRRNRFRRMIASQLKKDSQLSLSLATEDWPVKHSKPHLAGEEKGKVVTSSDCGGYRAPTVRVMQREKAARDRAACSMLLTHCVHFAATNVGGAAATCAFTFCKVSRSSLA